MKVGVTDLFFLHFHELALNENERTIIERNPQFQYGFYTVSYTHLTLPTIYSV